ncbi:MAG TPA: Nramp family divalent metal transporter [Rubrobacter sp.]|nr:Nramp family divalent metal transporter [Rubrobacter sp.]
MAETTQRSGELASELPSNSVLPAVEYRDLPEPQGLRKYIGASVIILATALGSGELILWPYITTQVGLGLVWLSVLGITVQFFLNMEIERYTLVTGETAVTGFSRMWVGWSVIFALGAILPNTIPGWASSGAELFTFIFGLGEGALPIVATIFLFSIAVSVTLSPVVYQLLEKVQAVLVIIVLAFIALAIFVATDPSAWAGVVTEAPQGVANLPTYWKEVGAISILAAVSFAGAGGANNLCQSNYVRDKGMGMGIHIPNIVSPITGEEVAAPSIGYMPPDTEENRRRFKGWWKVANQEHLITFWFLGALLLVSLCVLVFSSIGVQENIGTDLAFVEDWGAAMGEKIAPWFEEFFLIAGFVMLLSTNIGIMDYVGRITGDSLKVTVLRNSEFWSESKIYATVVWFMAIGGSILVWTGIEPIALLIMSAAGGFFVMAAYSTLLNFINRRYLPEWARLKGWRSPIMVFVAVFYVFPSLYVIYLLVTQGPSGVGI